MTITIGGDPWEYASWAAQVVIAVTAIAGAIFAGRQLQAVRRVSQATLLLELDSRFDSIEIREARELFSKMSDDIQTMISNENPQMNDEAKLNLCGERWRDLLSSLRTEDEAAYIKLIGFLGFFETMGMMVQKDYISQEDVFDLFKGPIADAHQCFRLHIEQRQKELGVPNGLFEHALRLGKNAQECD